MMPIQPSEESILIADWIKQHWTKPCPFCGAKDKWQAWGPYGILPLFGPATTAEEKEQRRSLLDHMICGMGHRAEIMLVICQEGAVNVPLNLSQVEAALGRKLT
jgi:hypothetical protein